MLELLQESFFIKAFIIGVITSITCAVAGNFLVASRQAVISDMLSHTTLAGVGIGFFFFFLSFVIWTVDFFF